MIRALFTRISEVDQKAFTEAALAKVDEEIRDADTVRRKTVNPQQRRKIADDLDILFGRKAQLVNRLQEIAAAEKAKREAEVDLAIEFGNYKQARKLLEA